MLTRAAYKPVCCSLFIDRLASRACPKCPYLEGNQSQELKKYHLSVLIILKIFCCIEVYDSIGNGLILIGEYRFKYNYMKENTYIIISRN